MERKVAAGEAVRATATVVKCGVSMRDITYLQEGPTPAQNMPNPDNDGYLVFEVTVALPGTPEFDAKFVGFSHGAAWNTPDSFPAGSTIPVLADPRTHEVAWDNATWQQHAAATGQTVQDVAERLAAAMFGPAPPTEPAASSVGADLERLAKLHATGELTDAEFDEAKHKLLGF